MQASQTLPSKILRTKKRLSESALNESTVITLGVCGLLLFLTYATRLISLGGSYGLIPLDIPVAAAPIEDRGLHSFRENPNSTLSANTLVIGITTNELIFGDFAAFTTQREDIRNKFLVPHIAGSPQVESLLKQVFEWSEDRFRKKTLREDGLVIIVPDAAVPIAVVAGVAESLRASKKFSHVVVGGGLL
jgi:hypothetical protein